MLIMYSRYVDFILVLIGFKIPVYLFLRTLFFPILCESPYDTKTLYVEEGVTMLNGQFNTTSAELYSMSLVQFHHY